MRHTSIDDYVYYIKFCSVPIKRMSSTCPKHVIVSWSEVKSAYHVIFKLPSDHDAPAALIWLLRTQESKGSSEFPRRISKDPMLDCPDDFDPFLNLWSLGGDMAFGAQEVDLSGWEHGLPALRMRYLGRNWSKSCRLSVCLHGIYRDRCEFVGMLPCWQLKDNQR